MMMRKPLTIKKRVKHSRGIRLSVVLLFIFLCVFMPSANAYTPPGENNPANPNTWAQLKWEEYKTIGLGTDKNGLTLSKQGCAQFALAVLYRKAGLRPDTYTPKDFNTEAKQILQAGKQGGIVKNGGLNWAGAGAQGDPGGSMTFVGLQSFGSAGSTDTSKIVDAYEKGYLTVLSVLGTNGTLTGHYVAVDYVENGIVHIVDSGNPVTSLDQPPYKGRFGRIISWKIEGKTKDDFLKIGTGQAPTGQVPTDFGVNDPESPIFEQPNWVLSEKDLVGMPAVTNIDDLGVFDIAVPVADDTLKAQTQALLDDINGREEASTKNFMRTTVAFIGILLMVYSLFLALAIAFDRGNSLFGVRAFQILTFGKMNVVEVSDRGRTSNDGKTVRHLSAGQAVGVALIFAGFGVILISGLAYSIVLHMVWFIQDLGV